MLKLKKLIKSSFAITVMSFSGLLCSAEVTIHANLPSNSNDFVSVDDSGSVYISNVGSWIGGGFDGSSIFKVNSDGTTETYSSSLVGPIGNALDTQGNLYVSNYNSGDLVKISSDSTTTTIASLGGASHAGGIAITSNNEIYVADYASNRVVQFDSEGNEISVIDDSSINGPAGLAIGDNDVLFIANYNDGKIFQYDGTNLTEIAHQTEGNNAFIGHITFADGAIYATGFDANKIFKVSLNGAIEEVEGTESTSFSNPNGIGANADGTILYVSEFGSSNKLYAIDLTKTDNITTPPVVTPPTKSGGGSFGYFVILISLLLLIQKPIKR